MATKTFESLVPLVNPSVPGCPYPLILQNIKDAAVRVCERTLAWRYAQPSYALSPGIYEYPYRKPTGTDVHAVFAAHLNGNPLLIRTLEEALSDYPQWADLYSGVDPSEVWETEATFNGNQFNGGVFNDNTAILSDAAVEDGTEPRIFTQVSPDQYIVLPMPDNAEVYNIRLFYALKPKRGVDYMSAYMLDELTDVIVHGALQELLVMPNASWTDRELASYHAKQYTFKVNERRARANLGNARATLSVRMRPFA